MAILAPIDGLLSIKTEKRAPAILKMRNLFKIF
jgi:hypothetical protein